MFCVLVCSTRLVLAVPKNLPVMYFEQLSPLDDSQTLLRTIQEEDLFDEKNGKYLDVDAAFVSTT